MGYDGKTEEGRKKIQEEQSNLQAECKENKKKIVKDIKDRKAQFETQVRLHNFYMAFLRCETSVLQSSSISAPEKSHASAFAGSFEN